MFKPTTANKYQKCWGCILYMKPGCLDVRHMRAVPARPSSEAHLCRPMAALRYMGRYLIEHRCPRGEEKRCMKKKLEGHTVRTIEPLHICVTCWVKHVLKGRRS